MGQLEQFLTKLWDTPVEALNEYHLLVDEESLDFKPGQQGVEADFQRAMEITIHFDQSKTALVRAALDSDPISERLSIQYLPWKRYDGITAMSGCVMAELDGSGSGIFMTSQLNGCRFTIQYSDGEMKKATVLHLAGTYGESKQGSLNRENAENTALGTGAPALRRRYSFRKYGGLPWSKLPQNRTYYDGDKATILGVRGQDDKWQFYAQQYRYDGAPLVGVKGVKTL